MTKIHFPQFSREDYSPFEMRQLIQALELRFQQLESNIDTSLDTTGGVDGSGGEFAPVDHTHREDDITDLAHTTSIFALDDVSPGITNGQGLIWNDTLSTFVAGDVGGSGGGGATNLNDLFDVNVPSPNDEDVLTWDSSSGQWIAQAPDTGGVGGSNTLVGLDDTLLTGASQYDLFYNSGSNIWRHTGADFRWYSNDKYVRLAKDATVRWLDESASTITMLEFAESGAPAGVTPDPDIGTVTFLAAFEEPNATAGNEVFTPDIDTNGVGNITWNITSGTQPTQVDAEISTAQAKYGTQSLYAKESAGVPSASWSSGTIPGSYFSFTGDFTVECDIYIVDNTSEIPICGSYVFGEYQWKWTLEAGTGRMGFTYGLTNTTITGSLSQETWGGGTNGVPSGAWHHIAICREGDQWYGWLDGVLSDGGAKTNANAINIPTTTNFNIFSEGPNLGANQIEVYMDNLRITDGVARYTTAFTPPTAAHDDGSTGVEAFVVGDPSYGTELDGTYVGLKNDIGINWDNSAGTDVEHLVFVNTVVGGAPDPDPNLGNVRLLVSAETAEVNSGTFTSDIGAITWTYTGGVPTEGSERGHISNTSFKHGAKSVYVKGETGATFTGLVGPVSASAEAQAAFDIFGTSASDEWTIEFWIDPSTEYTGLNPDGRWNNACPVISSRNTQNTTWFNMEITVDGDLTLVLTNSTGTGGVSVLSQVDNGISGGNLQSNWMLQDWTHWAIVRESDGEIRAYCNGNLRARTGFGLVPTQATTVFGWATTGNETINFGCTQRNGQVPDTSGYAAYIDDIRWTEGVARYTDGGANPGTNGIFTPPGPLDGTVGNETFIVGDPIYQTQIDGTTTTITGAAQLDTTLNVDGISTLNNDVTITTTLDDATGDEVALQLDYTTNKATSGADTGFQINMTDTLSPGTSLFADYQLGGVSIYDWGIDGTYRIYDLTGADSAAFSHDGTDFLTTFTNTDVWAVSGAAELQLLNGMDFWIRDGGQLFVFAADDVSYASFTHDNTDFNTTLNATTDWNINGTGNVWLRGGLGLRISDATNTNYVDFDHDGTTLDITGTNTTYLEVHNITALRMFDAGGVDLFAANNTDRSTLGTFNLETSLSAFGNTNQLSFKFYDFVQVRDGAAFEVFDAGDTDKAAFSHNGTDFSTAFTNTIDWDITGLTGEVFIDAALRTSGDLTVGGTTTTINSNIVSIADNIILLNSDATDPPTENAGLEIYRGGVVSNVFLRWNETSDEWEFTNDGTNYSSFIVDGATTNSMLRWNGTNWVEDSTLLASGNGDLTINRQANLPSVLTLGESTTARGSSADAQFIMYGEDAGSNITGLRFIVSSAVPTIDGVGPVPATGINMGLNLDLTGGRFLRIRDNTNADYVNFNHNGVNFNSAFTGTTDWQVSGLSNFNLGDGAGLRIYDITNADIARFSHDGTDFNTAFTNTTDWNITGADVRIAEQLTVTGGSLQDNTADVSVGVLWGNAYKSGVYVTDNFNFDSNDSAFAGVASAAGTAGRNIFYADHTQDYNTNFQSDQGWNAYFQQRAFTGGNNVGIVTARQYVTAGTANIGVTNTAYGAYTYLQDAGLGTTSMAHATGFRSHVTFAVATCALTNLYDFRAGALSNAANGTITNRYALYVDFDDTSTTNPWGVYSPGANVDHLFGGGGELRVADSTNADWAAFSHDGTDFNAAFTNTTDWNITGISALNAVNYAFNVDQTVGAGQDGYALIYNNGTGEIELTDLGTVSGGVADGTTTDATLRWSGSAWVETTLLQINDPAGNHSLTSVLDADTGNEVALALNYTTNKLTSGDDTGFQINMTDTASPGTSLLAEYNVGGVTKFSWSANPTFTMYDNTGLDSAAFNHDGTDFSTVFTGTGDWNITGLTGRIKQGAETLAYLSEAGVTDGTVTDSILRWDGAAWSETTQFRAIPSSNTFVVRGVSAGSNESKRISFQDSSDVEQAYLETTATGALRLGNVANDKSVTILGNDGGITQEILSWNTASHLNLRAPSGRDLNLYTANNLSQKCDNLGSIDFYYLGSNVARVVSEGTGAFLVSQTETGDASTFRRVLSVYDFGADAEYWDFDTNTFMGDPTQARFRLNNATLSSVTAIAVDDLTGSERDVAGILGAIQNGTRIKISRTDDLSVWAVYDATGAATDNTGWWEIPVSYVAHSGAFTALVPSKFTFDNLTRNPTIPSITDGTVTDATLRWDGADWVEETQVRVSAAGALTILDAGLTDSLAMSHDGTNFIFDFTNAADVRFTGLGQNGEVILEEGTWLRQFDSVNTNWGLMRMATVSGIEAWEFTTDSSSHIAFNAPVDFITSGDADPIRVVATHGERNTDHLQIFSDIAIGTFQLSTTTTNNHYMDFKMVGTAGTTEQFRWRDGNTTFMAFEITPTVALRLFGGADFQMYSQVGNDEFTIDLDNTDMNFTGTGMVDWNVTGWTSLNFDGTARLLEQAAAAVDVANYGQIWVKNDTPNAPYFTGDDGRDWPLKQFSEQEFNYNSTTTSGDPGLQTLRFNSLTPASITAMYIDEESVSEDWLWIISNLADGDIITVKSTVDSADYLVASVNGATTDNTGWWTVPLTIIHSGSIFTDSDTVRLSVQWFSQAAGGLPDPATLGDIVHYDGADWVVGTGTGNNVARILPDGTSVFGGGDIGPELRFIYDDAAGITWDHAGSGSFYSFWLDQSASVFNIDGSFPIMADVVIRSSTDIVAAYQIGSPQFNITMGQLGSNVGIQSGFAANHLVLQVGNASYGIKCESPLYIAHRAGGANLDYAGLGQLWVGSTNPQHLTFTNDDGDDWCAMTTSYQLHSTFTTNTAATQPGVGYFKFNNATMSSVTALYIQEEQRANRFENFEWPRVKSGDLITFKNLTTPANSLEFYVTGAGTDNSTWWTIPVSHLSGPTTPATNEVFEIKLHPTGGTGAVPQTITAGWSTGTGGSITVAANTGIFHTEQGADDNPGAGFGQYWVKNDAPNAPYFTGDDNRNWPLKQFGEQEFNYNSTTTSGDPGLQTLRFNSTTPASITAMYIDDESISEDWGWILSNLADGDIITVKSTVDSADYLVASVNGTTTDNTGWWTIPLTIIHSGSIFTDADTIRLSIQWFSQAGSGGLTGTVANDQIVVGTGASTVDSDANLTWNGTTLALGGAGKQLLLNGPETVPTAPTIGFGGGDTGFYERGADILAVSVGGAEKWNWNGNAFHSFDSLGGGLLNETTSATNPTLVPRRASTQTGIGANGANELSLIANSIEMVRLVEGTDDYALHNTPILVSESSAAVPDQTAYGQVWVRDSAPNTLMFTDDTGVDYPVAGVAAVQTKVKTAEETRTSNNTFTDDNHLSGFALEAGAYYRFEMLFSYQHYQTPDFKYRFQFSNTPQTESGFYYAQYNPENTLNAEQQFARPVLTTGAVVNATDAFDIIIRIVGFVLANATTGGTLDFQWAQNTSDAQTITARKGSFMRVEKIG